MKKRIIKLIIESKDKYWDVSGNTYTEMDEKDSNLNRELDEQLADDIIALFDESKD